MAKNKYENQLYKLLNENFGQDKEKPAITSEQKKSFTEAVGNYHSMGESIYRNSSLREITEKLGEIVNIAEALTLQESEHWFDNVTTSRHMKQLKEAYKVFEKTAKEISGLQQRLEGAYEDIGGVLNKYYKVNEALAEADKGDMDDDGIKEPDKKEYEDNKDAAIKKAMAETAAVKTKRPVRRLKDIANIGTGQSVIGLTKKR